MRRIPTKAAEGEYDGQVTVYTTSDSGKPESRFRDGSLCDVQTLGLQSAEIMPTMLEGGIALLRKNTQIVLGWRKDIRLLEMP